MSDATIGICIVFGIGLLSVAAVALAAFKELGASARRESEASRRAVDLFHKAAQASAFNATVTKNERIEAAQIELAGERIRFGAPPDPIPQSNYYNPVDLDKSDTMSAELRTVAASGTGVD